MLRFDIHIIKNIIVHPRLLLFIGIVLVIYSFVFEKAGFIRHYQLKRENIYLRAQVEKTRTKLENIQHEITSLKTDIDRMKQEAVKFGYAEPDEVIVIFR